MNYAIFAWASAGDFVIISANMSGENTKVFDWHYFSLLASGVALFWLEDAEITPHMESIASLLLFVLYLAWLAAHQVKPLSV